MAKRAVNARLDEDLVRRVDEEAARRGISKTAAFEDALERWLSPEPIRARGDENRTAALMARTGMTTAADLLRDRQVRLNKQMGWAEK